MRDRVMRWLLAGLFCVCLTECAFGADAPAGREYTGDFVLNREIPLNLTAGTAEHPRLVEVSWVRIEPIYGNSWAPTARIGWSSAAEATWQIRIELLDDKGNTLRHSRDRPTTFTGKVDGSNPAVPSFAEVRLEPMHWEDRRHAAKVRIALEPVADPTVRRSPGASARFELVVAVVEGKGNTPIPDGVVIAKSIHRGEQHGPSMSLHRTGAQGECRVAFSKADLAAASLTVQKQGYASVEKSWSGPYSSSLSHLPLTELPERHRIEMTPAQTIGGTVRDPTGKPIAGLQVQARAHWEEVGGVAYISRSVRTDRDGHWQVEGIPAGADTISLGFKHP